MTYFVNEQGKEDPGPFMECYQDWAVILLWATGRAITREMALTRPGTAWRIGVRLVRGRRICRMTVLARSAWMLCKRYAVDKRIQFELKFNKDGSQVLHVTSSYRLRPQLDSQDPSDSTYGELEVKLPSPRRGHLRAMTYFPLAQR
jgi:hypothetical protein